MGWRYQHNLDEENKRKHLQARPKWMRYCYRVGEWVFIILGISVMILSLILTLLNSAL